MSEHGEHRSETPHVEPPIVVNVGNWNERVPAAREWIEGTATGFVFAGTDRAVPILPEDSARVRAVVQCNNFNGFIGTKNQMNSQPTPIAVPGSGTISGMRLPSNAPIEITSNGEVWAAPGGVCEISVWVERRRTRTTE